MPDLDGKNSEVVGLAAGIGFAIVATLVVFLVIGLVLDQWLDKEPLFTLIGVGLGLIGAGYQLYELVQASDKNRPNGPIGRSMAKRMQRRQQQVK